MAENTSDQVKWLIIGSIIGAVVTPIVSALIRKLFSHVGLRLEGPRSFRR